MQLFLSKSNHLLSFKPDRINLKQRGFRGDGGRRRGGHDSHVRHTKYRPAVGRASRKTARRQDEKCRRLAALARLRVTEPRCALLGLCFQGQQHSAACVRLRL